MESSSRSGTSLRDREERHRRRSRSRSYDSEEERRRRRRQKERDREKETEREREKGRSSRYQEDRDDERERKRRRSRSPGKESSYRRTDERQPRLQSIRGSSPSHRSRDYENSRGVRDRHGLDTQVTRKSTGPLPSQEAAFKSNKDPGAVIVANEAEKQKPNFAATGLLAAASNSIAQADGTAIVLKYHEPAEARKPSSKDEWKLFIFKGAEIMETIDLNVRSCWLVGRELAVVDLPAEHPSVSKQHAAIQFRYIDKRNEYGDKIGKVKPYLIDLESANGTLLNKEEVPGSRYLELRDKDMIQFGHSTREYVLMLSPK